MKIYDMEKAKNLTLQEQTGPIKLSEVMMTKQDISNVERQTLSNGFNVLIDSLHNFNVVGQKISEIDDFFTGISRDEDKKIMFTDNIQENSKQIIIEDLFMLSDKISKFSSVLINTLDNIQNKLY